mgnify:CR=1 FL=1
MRVGLLPREGARSYRFVILLLAALGLLVSALPVVIITIMSFSAAETTSFPPEAYSWRWYQTVLELFAGEDPSSAQSVGDALVTSLMVGAIVTVLSLYFTSLAVHNIFVIVSMITLTAVLFSLGGFINAVYATKFDDVTIVPTFILTPLTYLGGVFYSISLLPEFWQWVSLANPILYMVNAFRYGILGVSDINVWVAYVMISVFTLILYAWAMSLLARGKGLRT